MKTNFRFMIASLFSILILFPLNSCTAEPRTPAVPGSVREDQNKALVLKYFQEILDGEQYGQMSEVFTPDVVMHRPEGTLTNLYVIQPFLEATLSPHTFETTIHEVVASGDYVAVRLNHRMTFSTEQASMQSRLGRFDVRGKTIEWEAMVMFRFEDGKIAEEWVTADELGKLLQVGTLELTTNE